jgi:hypothetical protein
MITTRSATIPIVLGLATSAAPPAYAQIGPAKASELIALTNGSGSTPCPGQSNWNAVTFLPLSGTTFKIPPGNVLVITELAVTAPKSRGDEHERSQRVVSDGSGGS